ncbi:MAG: hypothetical protein CR986_02210 [Ignavibacteriae bacterium]|nr:MAG: hypothetical protein CR986_02210 [Ignavibacteriota bacterium]
MKFINFFLFLFCATIIFSQNIISPVYIEHNSIFTDSLSKEIISYRVPFSNLLFKKEDDIYKSEFSITFELYKEKKFVQREILNEKVYSNSYEETLSKNSFFENYFILKLNPGEYTLATRLNLNSTEVQYQATKIKIKIDSNYSTKVFNPIIVQNGKRQSNKFIVANYGNTIPFSPDEYSLLLTLPDSSVKKVTYQIYQFDKLVKEETASLLSNTNLAIEKKDDKLVVKITDIKSNVSNFLITDFNKLLFEGKAELKIKYNNTVEVKKTLDIKWFYKPNVLNNLAYSIKLLQYVEDERTVTQLLANDEKNYLKELTSYWNKKYPSNGIKYNYAMAEYYKRADYAYQNFSSLNRLDGAERDRGRIYIMYGKPTSVERNYNEMNEVIEVWFYENLGRTFIFKDIKGTGKFDLSD